MKESTTLAHAQFSRVKSESDTSNFTVSCSDDEQYNGLILITAVKGFLVDKRTRLSDIDPKAKSSGCLLCYL